MKPRNNPFLAAASNLRLPLVAFGLVLSQIPANASTYWWDTTTTGTWATGGNWSNSQYSGGTTGTAAGSGDIAIFNQAGITAASTTVNLDADVTVNGIVFNNTSTATILQSPTHNSLSLGSGGILINAGAAAVSLGDAGFANYLGFVNLGVDQSWVNNSSNTFTFNSTVQTGGASRTLTLGGSGSFLTKVDVKNNGANLLSLVKNGSGTLTFQKTTTSATTTVFSLTGGVTLNAGQLTLNSSQSSGSGVGAILASQALTMGGGGLLVNYNTSNLDTGNNQTFTGVTFNPGASIVASTMSNATTGGASIITLGSTNRTPGSTVTYSITGKTDTNNRVRISSSSWTASTVITDSGVAYATAIGSATANTTLSTMIGNDWATPNSGNILKPDAYAPSYTASTSTTLSGNADVSGAINTTLAADASPATLRFSNASARTITATGFTLTTGGILISSAVGSNNQTITGGTLRSAATVANKDLVIITNQSGANYLDLSGTVIANAAAGATGLTKSGTGGLVLNSAANTYTGPTYINGGYISIVNDGTGTTNPLGAYPGIVTANAITLNGGGLAVSGTTTIGANRGVTLGGNGGTLYSSTSQALTINSAITSATGVSTANSYGALQFGNSNNLGTVTLGGNNTFVGGVQINNGELKLANAGALNSTAGSENTVTMNQAATVAASALAGAGSLLTLNGNDMTIGDLKATGTAGAFPAVVQNASASNKTLTIGNSQNLQSGVTFNGLIQDGAGGGNLALVKTGTGTLSLAPSIVRASTSGTSGTFVINVADTSFLQVGTAVSGTGVGTNATIQSIVPNTSITVSVVNSGTVSGNLTFSQKLNTYTGGTTIKNGVLNAGSQALPFNSGTTYPIILGDATTNTSGVLVSSGSNSVSSIATAGTGGLNNLITVGSGVGFTVNGSGAQTFAGTIGGAGNFTYSGSGSLNVTGKMTSSAGTITASGTGSLILGGANTYASATAISNGAGGSLTVTDPKAFGATSGITFASGGNAKLVINTASTLLNGDGTAFSRPITGTTSTTGAYAINVDYTNASGVAFTQDLSGGAFNFGTSSTATLNATGLNYSSGTAILKFGTTTIGGTNNAIVQKINPVGIAVVIGDTVNTTPTGTNTTSITLDGTSTGNQIGAMANGIAGSFTNTVSITKSNTSTWKLSGNNSFTGGVTISGGTLQLGNAGALNSTSGSENAVAFGAATTGTLSLNGNSVVVANLTGSATGPVVQNDNATTTATLTVGNSTNLGGTYAGVIQNGTGSAALALTKAGSGTLTLSGTNTYTGDTTISAGTLAMASNLIGSSPNIFIGNGATLSAATSGFTMTSGQTITGTGTTGSVNGLSTLGLATSGNNTISNNASGQLSLTRMSVFGSGNTITAGDIQAGVSGTSRGLNIANGAAGTLTITGGSLTTNGNATAGDILGSTSSSGVGNLIINGGSYTANSAQGLNIGFGAGSGTLTLTSGSVTLPALTFAAVTGFTSAVVNLDGGTFTLGSLTVTSGNANQFNFNGGTLKASAALALANGAVNVTLNVKNGGAIIDTNGNNVTISNALVNFGGTSTGGLTKQGGGTLTLSGASTYSGKTVVQNGTLSYSVGNASATADQQLGKNAALDLGVASTSSGTLLYTGGAGTLAKNINALGNGSDTIQNGGTGLLTLSGTLTKNGTVLTLKGGANGITVDGVIQGASANSDLVIDGGTTTLTNVETYNGPTYIQNGGTLKMSGSGLLPATTALILDSTGSGSSTFQILSSSGDQTIASLTGASTSSVLLDNKHLTVGDSNNTIYAGSITGGNTSQIIKVGSGSLSLTGVSSSYTGDTSVNNGTLSLGVNNAMANSHGMTVGGATTSGTLDIGSTSQGIGSLAFGAAGGTVKMAANQTAAAQLAASGAVVLGSSNAINLTGMSTSAGLYRLISGSSLSGTFGTVTGLSSAYSLVYSGTELDAQHKATISLALGSNPTNVRVGSQTVNLSIGNTAPSGSAVLSYTLGGVSGSGTRVAGAGSSAATGTYTAVAGPNSFNITASDAAATNSPQTVAFSQTGFNPAVANSIADVSVGKTRVGGTLSGTAALSISNTAPSGSYTEGLNATVGSGSGASGSGSISNLSGGSSDTSSISLGLVGADCTTAGLKTGSVTINLASSGTNSGLSDLGLVSQTVGVTGAVYDYADAVFSKTGGTGTFGGGGTSYTLDFGSGLAANTTYTATIQLANYLLPSGYQDDLGGSYNNIANGFASGVEGTSIASLVAGSSNSFTITFNTGGTGNFGDTLTFSGLSQQSGLGDAGLGPFNIVLSANVVPEPDVATLIGGIGMLCLLRRRR